MEGVAPRIRVFSSLLITVAERSANHVVSCPAPSPIASALPAINAISSLPQSRVAFLGPALHLHAQKKVCACAKKQKSNTQGFSTSSPSPRPFRRLQSSAPGLPCRRSQTAAPSNTVAAARTHASSTPAPSNPRLPHRCALHFVGTPRAHASS
jgi:hypothetical protein